MKSNAKRILAVLLAVCLLAFTGAAALAAGEPWTLLDTLEPEKTVILTSAAPTESETAAAELLQAALRKVTDTQFAIVTKAPEDNNIIALSIGSVLKNEPKGSYLLYSTAGSDVFMIDGADARGLFNGVYAFLRTFCGVEMYSADVKTYPYAGQVTVERPYEVRYRPSLEYADTDWISPHDLEFSLANGLNGSYSPIESVYGGKVNYIWFCHSLTNGIVPEGELFADHPEYFALTEDGKREATQLCLSNPAVVERAISDVKNALAANYNPDAALNIVSVTQDDNQKYCVCENCTALAEQYGGQSGLMLWFVNQIADAVAPEYPDVVIDTFAYQYTRHAPTGITPRENVCVRLCSIECCFAHALDDPACEDNVAFMQDLSDWSRISNRLYVWDYVTNFAQTLGVFPNFGVLRQNIDTFRKNSVVGIYEEGAYYAGNCNVEFFDLRAYLLSCLMRDENATDGDVAAWTHGFLAAALENEEAAAKVEEILQILTDHAGDTNGHLHIYYSMKNSLHDMTKADVKHVNDLWDEAEALTQGDAAALRLKRMRLAWRYYEACTGVGEFRTLPGMTSAAQMQKLINDLKDVGVTQYSEGTMLDDVSPTALFAPDQWRRGDAGVYIAAYIAAGLLLLLNLVTAIRLFIKKHRIGAVILLVLGVLCVPVAIRASVLFIEWDHLALYALWDAALLLCAAGFCMTAAWAMNGFVFPKGKKLVFAVLGSLTAAALPYEIVILVINTIIFKGLRPTFSITLSAFTLMLLIAAALIVILAALRKKKTND